MWSFCSHSYGGGLLLLPDAHPLMRRARDSRVPDLPMSVQMLNGILEAPEWAAWALGSDTADERLYWRMISQPDGNAAVYRDRGMIERVSNNLHSCLFMGMLEVKPRYPNSVEKVLLIGTFVEVGNESVVSLTARMSILITFHEPSLPPSP